MKVVIVVLFCFSIYKWFSWWLAATVLASWMAEKNYAPPETKDRERLAKWAVHKAFKLG